jgi:cytochrome c oxidase subunit 1
VHNTAYIVGHLHLTVGTAVTLTFMGITYWLVPHLAGRPLWSRTLALGQVWLWFAGMMIFSPTLHELGLRGMPRRTMIGHITYMQPEWKTLLPLVGVGGALLFVSALLYFLNMVLTVTASRRLAQPALEFAEAVSGPDQAPAFLDRWRPWLALAAILIAVAYGPTLVRLAVTTPLTTPGLRVW